MWRHLRYGKMIMNDETGGMWAEAVVVLSRNSPEGTEKNHEDSQLR
jgi:hypothetical protein